MAAPSVDFGVSVRYYCRMGNECVFWCKVNIGLMSVAATLDWSDLLLPTNRRIGSTFENIHLRFLFSTIHLATSYAITIELPRPTTSHLIQMPNRLNMMLSQPKSVVHASNHQHPAEQHTRPVHVLRRGEFNAGKKLAMQVVVT